MMLSEKDRIGIGTFQPKDEKNQDSTELTGDINYRKIAEYGSDSDPRAFNFDGEFNIANRGIIEFIEILKLDVAFLYDLLGASQEHKIKPKKFAQTDIDEVIAGHSVAGHEPHRVPPRRGPRLDDHGRPSTSVIAASPTGLGGARRATVHSGETRWTRSSACSVIASRATCSRPTRSGAWSRRPRTTRSTRAGERPSTRRNGARCWRLRRCPQSCGEGSSTRSRG